MLKIEKMVLPSPEQWEIAIEGMRNPLNSWEKSDSYITHIEDPQTLETANYQFMLGEADEALMKRLAAAGSTHSKYRRMLPVWVTLTAPMYFLKQLDTYRIAVVSNSCSTMHKIHAKPFELSDFSHEHLFGMSEEVLKKTIAHLNECRESFVYLTSINKGGKACWDNMIQLLPSSYNQKRTLMLNYKVLAAIYRDRKNHKLEEWHTFCDWVESLPHSDIIIGEVSE